MFLGKHIITVDIYIISKPCISIGEKVYTKLLTKFLGCKITDFWRESGISVAENAIGRLFVQRRPTAVSDDGAAARDGGTAFPTLRKSYALPFVWC